MKILVCGGRDFGVITRYDFPGGTRPVHDEGWKQFGFGMSFIEKFAVENSTTLPDEHGLWMPEDITIISGCAKGADQIGIDWAVINWCKLEEYPADWKKYGKAAGSIRNKQMLEEGKPDVVIAFPGGKGTAHMVKIAKEAGVKVIEVEYNEQQST